MSSHTIRTDPDHERILEIFVRANSGGTKLSKSDLLLSTLTLHWGAENAREVINEFVDELNGMLTRKNRLDKDFVMKKAMLRLGCDFKKLSARECHRLRIALKKFRYTAEFFRSLYQKKRQKDYFHALTRLQLRR
jgi:CHAD domain-containing protein